MTLLLDAPASVTLELGPNFAPTRRTKRADEAAAVLGRLSAADRRALAVLRRGAKTSFDQFRRLAFPGLFTRGKAERTMDRLYAAGAVDVFEHRVATPAERVQLVRLI